MMPSKPGKVNYAFPPLSSNLIYTDIHVLFFFLGSDSCMGGYTYKDLLLHKYRCSRLTSLIGSWKMNLHEMLLFCFGVTANNA